ncbi:RNA-directed DNA polymerase, eukaryota, reverse transcriptase zinc-binding domain protein [Tanacetum coccineum]
MDIIKYVQNFNSPALLSRGCNSSFISLVPKVSNPLCILDYESISLIGCQYKIIAKILAERSKLVLSFVICKEQFTYLHVHQIIDGPLMVNEIISWVSHQRSKLMIFNVDFEKAFDTLNWIFLDDVMRQMGFDLYGVGVARNGVDWMSSTLKCTPGSLPFNYLGFPVGPIWAGFLRVVQPRIEKFHGSLGSKSWLMVPWAALELVGWKINDSGVPFINSFKHKVISGFSTRIWKDVWFGSLNLDQTYPRLFALALDKNCSVQQWVSASSKNRDLWRRDLFFSREIEELENLIV